MIPKVSRSNTVSTKNNNCFENCRSFVSPNLYRSRATPMALISSIPQARSSCGVEAEVAHRWTPDIQPTSEP